MNREERRRQAREGGPTEDVPIDQLPPELQAALAAAPALQPVMRTLDVQAWRFGIEDEGTDDQGRIMRVINCVVADGSMVIRLHGIGVEQAKVMADALTKPHTDLLVPDSKIIVPGKP